MLLVVAQRQAELYSQTLEHYGLKLVVLWLPLIPVMVPQLRKPEDQVELLMIFEHPT
eukprot:gene33748-41635_t